MDRNNDSEKNFVNEIIEVDKKYGCLKVFDLGEEYTHSELYLGYVEERDSLMNENSYYQSVSDEEEKRIILEQYPTSSFVRDLNRNPSDINKIFDEFIKHRIYWNKQRLAELKSKFEVHYKCQCKCGKIYYYNAKTITSAPRYCFYPVPISTRFTKSIKASNATYHKRQKYAGIESVELCDKSECLPSDVYCDYYNAYRIKQLTKQEEKLKQEIAEIPRENVLNYDVDLVGRQYESLYIEECVNEHLESEPRFYFSQSHHRCWNRIKVYKQYRCTCSLCGKEQLVTCDKFGIYPPTKYGYHAYYGYWSEVSCDCHPISSFQWIVCKLLYEANVKYSVEYSFPDLYGSAGINLLRFDFAIFDSLGNVKCLIECQGEQHYKPVDEFGGEESYRLQIKNDELKKEYVASHHIPLISISYKKKRYEEIQQILQKNNVI